MDDMVFVNGRYRVLYEDGLGPLSGRMVGPLAEVFRVRDAESGEEVALKRFRPQYSRDARFAVRFREQLKRLAAVKHPALVSIVDYGFDGECFFIASEWVDGVNLSTYLAEYGSLEKLPSNGSFSKLLRSGQWGGVAFSPEAAVYVARRVCAALAALHEAGLVHRGLKPENIFITAEHGDVKVSDATLSLLASESGLSQTNVMMGSVAYMSPEQARGREVGPESDIYSLGVILYEMLTDELPFKADDSWSLVRMHVHAAPPSPRLRNRAVSPELAAVVTRTLQKTPEERFATGDSRGCAMALDAALAPLPQGDDLLWLTAPRAGGQNLDKRQVLKSAFKRQFRATASRLLQIWEGGRRRWAKQGSRLRDLVRRRVRPRAEGAFLQVKEVVERRARPLWEKRRAFTFGQLLLLNFMITFIIAFLLLYLLSGAVTGAQETSAVMDTDGEGARRAEIRKRLQTPLPVQTPTLAPTAVIVEEAPQTVTATVGATEVATEPAPPVQAVQENGGNGSGPPPDGGPPPHAGGPPPDAGPPPHAGGPPPDAGPPPHAGGPPPHAGGPGGRGRP